MRMFRIAFLSLGAILLALLIAGHLNALHPAFDSISHFRLQLAVFGMLAGLALLTLQSLLGGAALLIVSALSFFITALPAYKIGETHAAEGIPATYRLLQANLRFDNRTPEEFIRLLGETQPDIATIEEIPDMWAQRLKTVSAMYPHQLICPGRDKIGGVAIISRRPFADDEFAYCDGDGAVAVQSVDLGGKAVTISAMHLEWPWPKMQPQQLVWLKPVFNKMKETGNPVLIGGDMNATPWSAAVAQIADETCTRVLPQIRGTWTFRWIPPFFAPWAGLPIDNILASSGVSVKSATTQRAIGSDHRPILVEFSINPIQKSEQAPGSELET